MKQKIISLMLTIATLLTIVCLSYLTGVKLSPAQEIVKVEEYGLHSSEVSDAKLRKLIKTYEVMLPDEVPWKTCQQEM